MVEIQMLVYLRRRCHSRLHVLDLGCVTRKYVDLLDKKTIVDANFCLAY